VPASSQSSIRGATQNHKLSFGSSGSLRSLVDISSPSAYGANTLYVANNGVDSITCGPSVSPSRSITQGITNAAPGDTVIVNPGKYGDVNGNGTLGESGEETRRYTSRRLT